VAYYWGIRGIGESKGVPSIYNKWRLKQGKVHRPDNDLLNCKGMGVGRVVRDKKTANINKESETIRKTTVKRTGSRGKKIRQKRNSWAKRFRN